MLVGTSATSKPREDHLHTPHESAPCTPNRIPIPPSDPPPDRSARASRLDPPLQDTSTMPDQFGPTARPRGGPRSRRATVMVTTTATWLRPGHVRYTKIGHDSELETQRVPHGNRLRRGSQLPTRLLRLEGPHAACTGARYVGRIDCPTRGRPFRGGTPISGSTGVACRRL